MVGSKNFRWSKNDKLRKKLIAMNPAVEDALRKSILASAKVVLKSATSLVPKRTGKLASQGQAFLLPITPREIEGVVQYGSSIAHLVEFGTGPRVTTGKGRIKAGVSRGSMPAQPFLFPAMLINETANKRRIARAINGALKKVSAK